MQLNGGWLVGARRVPSPHHDCRPDDENPSLLVVTQYQPAAGGVWRPVD